MDVGNLGEALAVLNALMKKHPLWEKVCMSHSSESEQVSLWNTTAQ